MYIIDYINNLCNGRGPFPFFLVISSWGVTLVLMVILIYHLFLYMIGKKYGNKRFLHDLGRETENNKKEIK